MADPTATPLDPAPDSDQPTFWNPFDEQLPSGRSARVSPMRGAAEQALVSASQADNDLAIAQGITDFILSCVVDLDGKAPTREDILDLEEHDRRALQLRIRRLSYPSSSLADFKWACRPPAMPRGQGCGCDKNHHTVDLDKLVVRPLSALKPLLLPVAKKTAAFAPVTGRTALEYIRRRQTPAGKLDLGAMFLARKVTLDGKLASRDVLDQLIAEDRSALRKALNEWGGPDSRVQAECNDCKRLMTSFAEALPGFFFPEMDEA